jgi:hypothetical protein
MLFGGIGARMGWGRYSFHGAEGDWGICATIASLALSIIGVVLGVFIERGETTDGALFGSSLGAFVLFPFPKTLHGIQGPLSLTLHSICTSTTLAQQRIITPNTNFVVPCHPWWVVVRAARVGGLTYLLLTAPTTISFCKTCLTGR